MAFLSCIFFSSIKITKTKNYFVLTNHRCRLTRRLVRGRRDGGGRVRRGRGWGPRVQGHTTRLSPVHAACANVWGSVSFDSSLWVWRRTAGCHCCGPLSFVCQVFAAFTEAGGFTRAFWQCRTAVTARNDVCVNNRTFAGDTVTRGTCCAFWGTVACGRGAA